MKHTNFKAKVFKEVDIIGFSTFPVLDNRRIDCYASERSIYTEAPEKWG